MSARILVVDDIEANVRLLEAKLTAEYYEVSSAMDGPTALAMAANDLPDIILLDVMMPHKNGLEVCYELKNDPKMARVPVLILTALTQTSAKSDDYWKTRSRADDFITKPFKSADLIKRIETLLANAAPEGEGQTRLKI